MMDTFVRGIQVFAACGKPTLLGIPSWYSYLDVTTDKVTGACEINYKTFKVPGSFLNIGLAILDMALHAAALVAVAFVIYGGIQLITSRGEPDKAAKARETIIAALVGLAITIVAIPFVAFLGSRLG